MLWNKVIGAGGLVGAGGGPAGASIYGIMGTSAQSGGTYDFTHTSAPLGPAYTDREIWVVAITYSAYTNITDLNTVTVGGQSMTLVNQTNGVWTANTPEWGIAYAKYQDNGVLGTSADIVLEYEKTQTWFNGVLVFTSTPTSTVLGYYGSATPDDTCPDGSITTSSAGWSFYASATHNGTSGTIANFNNDYNFDIGSGEWVTVGYNSPETNGTTTVTTPTGTTQDSRIITGISAY